MKKFTAVHLFVVAVALHFLHSPSPAAAEDSSDNTTELHGYYKILPISSRSTTSDEEFFAVTNRLRLDFKKQLNPWEFCLTLDNEAVVNDFADTPDFDAIRSQEQKKVAALDLDKVSTDNDHLYLKHSIYRAYVKYYQPEFQATVGKQAIDFGKLRFYSPLDVFNPVGELAIEHDERPGVDAVNLNYSPEAFAGINAVVAPGRNDETTGGGLKLYHKISTYDAALIAATVRKDQIYGFSFDGYLKSAGFRGELAHVREDNGRNFPRAGLGLDYTFSDKLYGLVEQFYNGGNDDTDSTAFTTSYLTARRVMSLKRNLTSLWLKYSLTPLWTLNNYVVYDWDGKSAALNPEMVYNLSRNVDLKLGTQFFWGNDGAEFGSYENVYYAEVKLFF